MKKKVIFSLIVLIVATGVTLATLVGLWIHTTKTNPYFDTLPSNEKQQIKTLTSEQVILTYFDAINNKNYELALALLSPRYLRPCKLTFKRFLTHGFKSAVEDTLKHMKTVNSITNVTFDYELSKHRSSLPPLPPNTVQLAAYNNVKSNDPNIGEHKNLLTFIRLVKDPNDGHWQIDGFNSSP
jgi:4-amino-4-deoxy-L-arabinose transferase-like glycosyltransferase